MVSGGAPQTQPASDLNLALYRRPTPVAGLNLPPVNVHAAGYFIAAGRCRCWSCAENTDVFVLAIEPPYWRLDAAGEWQERALLAVLSYTEWLCDGVSGRLVELAPRYFRDSSQWHQRPYWMNHCQYCSAKIGDYETIEAASSPFNVQKVDIRKLKCLTASEEFEAVAIPSARHDPKSD